MNGLTNKEVIVNRKKYGTNEITGVKKDTFFKLLLESLGDPIIRILLIALGIKTIFLIKDFDWYETVGIVISIIIASLISTISEYGSSKAFERLQEESSKIKCKVKRNGQVIEILIDDIVKGDILVLSSGDKIGADGIIISGNIEIDESSMNGETKSVNKKENDYVYRGCVVYNGNANILVDKIGNNTYYGKMVKELGEKSDISPLKERLNVLAGQISKLGYIGSVLVSVSYLFNKIIISNGFQIDKIISTISNISLLFAYILHALTLSVTIIVVSVPEGLPMMVTLVLSSNMKRMLRNNVLVRKLVGIETSGSMNILFTDKTGTITKGKLEVTSLLLANNKKYNNLNNLSKEYKNILEKNLIYNNESSYDNNSNQIIGGNITDKSILNFIKKKKDKNIKELSRIYFNSKNKYSLCVIEDNKKKYKLVKGASEVIIPKCERYLDENNYKHLILHKDNIYNEINKITSKGIRVVALAYNNNDDNSLDDLILIGFLLIKDDIRKESISAIRTINNAGINVVMLTGDNKNTAESIAKEVGIINNEKDISLTSNDLNNLTDEEIKKILPNLKVVSRALPEDKSRLVRIAKSKGLVVGMTGDGVNDAIALKKADIGFSMGSGTEVAKEASDIIILDDNIKSIETSILFGRTIFKSIRKFIIFQLTVNLCAVSISIIGPFIGIPAPVTVIQMLWINMVMDTLAGLAFSFEPPLKEYMEEKPKKRNEEIINKYMLNEILITGLYSSILCIMFLKTPLIKNLFRNNNTYLLTAFFGLFIFMSIFNSFNARTNRLNILGNITKNKVFLAIICLVAFIQIIMIYYGGKLFRTSGLNIKEFIIMIFLSITVIPIDMIRKIYIKKNNYQTGV
ncbi:MAG: calcium-translocating P-type ATPase, PMCA-type [Bacilli bacterium]|nr:calcium-translocating P-type ATPase, PMCA-type [Bacilli bacterium]